MCESCSHFDSLPLIYVYVLTLQWATPLAAFILGMICFGIDEIGVELEDPLGNDRNDMEMWEVIRRLDKELALLSVMNPGTDSPVDLLDFSAIDAEDADEHTVPSVRADILAQNSQLVRCLVVSAQIVCSILFTPLAFFSSGIVLCSFSPSPPTHAHNTHTYFLILHAVAAERPAFVADY